MQHGAQERHPWRDLGSTAADWAALSQPATRQRTQSRSSYQRPPSYQQSTSQQWPHQAQPATQQQEETRAEWASPALQTMRQLVQDTRATSIRRELTRDRSRPSGRWAADGDRSLGCGWGPRTWWWSG